MLIKYEGRTYYIVAALGVLTKTPKVLAVPVSISASTVSETVLKREIEDYKEPSWWQKLLASLGLYNIPVPQTMLTRVLKIVDFEFKCARPILLDITGKNVYKVTKGEILREAINHAEYDWSYHRKDITVQANTIIDFDEDKAIELLKSWKGE